MKSILICITKHNDAYNFTEWLQYHKNIGFNEIYIFDNNSIIDIKNICDKFNNVHYIKYFKEWPNQNKLYTDIFDNKTNIKLTNHDYVTCVDDDEYLWIDQNFKNINETLCWYFTTYNTDSIYLPWNFMSSKKLLDKTLTSWISSLIYRRNESLTTGIQGKAIIKYDKKNKYNWNYVFNNKNLGGHAPFINNRRISINSIGEIVEGLYSLPDTLINNSTKAKIRLFHYHIKSKRDWLWKIKRGSAANINQIYDIDIKKNRFYGNYTIKDISMLEAKKRFLI